MKRLQILCVLWLVLVAAAAQTLDEDFLAATDSSFNPQFISVLKTVDFNSATPMMKALATRKDGNVNDILLHMAKIYSPDSPNESLWENLVMTYFYEYRKLHSSDADMEAFAKLNPDGLPAILANTPYYNDPTFRALCCFFMRGLEPVARVKALMPEGEFLYKAITASSGRSHVTDYETLSFLATAASVNSMDVRYYCQIIYSNAKTKVVRDAAKDTMSKMLKVK